MLLDFNEMPPNNQPSLVDFYFSALKYAESQIQKTPEAKDQIQQNLINLGRQAIQSGLFTPDDLQGRVLGRESTRTRPEIEEPPPPPQPTLESATRRVDPEVYKLSTEEVKKRVESRPPLPPLTSRPTSRFNVPAQVRAIPDFIKLLKGEYRPGEAPLAPEKPKPEQLFTPKSTAAKKNQFTEAGFTYLGTTKTILPPKDLKADNFKTEDFSGVSEDSGFTDIQEVELYEDPFGQKYVADPRTKNRLIPHTEYSRERRFYDVNSGTYLKETAEKSATEYNLLRENAVKTPPVFENDRVSIHQFERDLPAENEFDALREENYKRERFGLPQINKLPSNYQLRPEGKSNSVVLYDKKTGDKIILNPRSIEDLGYSDTFSNSRFQITQNLFPEFFNLGKDKPIDTISRFAQIKRVLDLAPLEFKEKYKELVPVSSKRAWEKEFYNSIGYEDPETGEYISFEFDDTFENFFKKEIEKPKTQKQVQKGDPISQFDVGVQAEALTPFLQNLLGTNIQTNEMNKMIATNNRFMNLKERTLPALVKLVEVQPTVRTGVFTGGPKGVRLEDVPPKYSGGSGFITPEGYVVTNQHVTEGGNRMIVTSDGKQHRILGVYENPGEDISIVKVDWQGKYPSISLRPTDVKEKEFIMSFGPASGDPKKATTAGEAVDLSKYMSKSEIADFYKQNNAPIYSALVVGGKSGGPIVDATGKVVGINSRSLGGYKFGAGGVPASSIAKTLDKAEKFFLEYFKQ